MADGSSSKPNGNWVRDHLLSLTTCLIHQHSHESGYSNDEMAADIREIKKKLGEAGVRRQARI